MGSNEGKRTCEERIAEEMERRLKQFLPDVESWSAEECSRYLSDEEHRAETSDIRELRQEVRNVLQERTCESVLSLERSIAYKLCLSWGGCNGADRFVGVAG